MKHAARGVQPPSPPHEITGGEKNPPMFFVPKVFAFCPKFKVFTKSLHTPIPVHWIAHFLSVSLSFCNLFSNLRPSSIFLSEFVGWDRTEHTFSIFSLVLIVFQGRGGGDLLSLGNLLRHIALISQVDVVPFEMFSPPLISHEVRDQQVVIIQFLSFRSFKKYFYIKYKPPTSWAFLSDENQGIYFRP